MTDRDLIRCEMRLLRLKSLLMELPASGFQIEFGSIHEDGAHNIRSSYKIHYNGRTEYNELPLYLNHTNKDCQKYHEPELFDILRDDLERIANSCRELKLKTHGGD